MGKIKEYAIELQEKAYEKEVLNIYTVYSSAEDYSDYCIEDKIAERNALECAKEMLEFRHTVTEVTTGFTRKIYKVNKNFIKKTFPADNEKDYIDWNAFTASVECIMSSIKDNDYKKALERLLDSRYTNHLHWLPPVVGIRV